jgi:hypothetical protein
MPQSRARRNLALIIREDGVPFAHAKPPASESLAHHDRDTRSGGEPYPFGRCCLEIAGDLAKRLPRLALEAGGGTVAHQAWRVWGDT